MANTRFKNGLSSYVTVVSSCKVLTGALARPSRTLRCSGRGPTVSLVRPGVSFSLIVSPVLAWLGAVSRRISFECNGLLPCPAGAPGSRKLQSEPLRQCFAAEPAAETDCEPLRANRDSPLHAARHQASRRV